MTCEAIPELPGLCIPDCWACVTNPGDCAGTCTCEGSANAAAMDRQYRAWVRLQGIRTRREIASGGPRTLPGSVVVRDPAPYIPGPGAPVVLHVWANRRPAG